MYIGRLGDGTSPDDGIYILLKEIIDNSIDEYIMGHGKRIDITIADGKVVVRDYGRGIPLGKVIECVSIINTGAKYNDEVFQFSVGLNGVGTKAVNALSKHFRVVSFREGKFFEAKFEKGTLKDSKKGASAKEPTGTLVEFFPDTEIFGDYSFDEEFVEQRLWYYAYLNRGLTLKLGKRSFRADNGLKDLLTAEVGEDASYPILHGQSERLEFAFTGTQEYGERHFSFVNGQYTADGGTHLSAFREGLLKGINQFYKAAYNGSDVREGMVGAIAIRIQNPVFESQTKHKLGNPEIRSWIVGEVRDMVTDLLHKTPDASKALKDRILQNERLRKELNAVRKEAREAAKKVSLRVPNLKDCKYHRGDKKLGEESTIFLTEGQSASGPMVAARNVLTQAIFSLRGKPQNMYGKKRGDIYKNEELFNVMVALGIENGVEELRYERVIIATDADYDGFHIRNLLLTFFLTYFEELVMGGHLFILETPLFRVRNKTETIYCYSDQERLDALERIKSPEITRFKGLGEISPHEFGQFIGEDIRLIPVSIRSLKRIPETLEFYMGKNTPTRKNYIMEHLV